MVIIGAKRFQISLFILYDLNVKLNLNTSRQGSSEKECLQLFEEHTLTRILPCICLHLGFEKYYRNEMHVFNDT